MAAGHDRIMGARPTMRITMVAATALPTSNVVAAIFQKDPQVLIAHDDAVVRGHGKGKTI